MMYNIIPRYCCSLNRNLTNPSLLFSCMFEVEVDRLASACLIIFFVKYIVFAYFTFVFTACSSRTKQVEKFQLLEMKVFQLPIGKRIANREVINLTGTLSVDRSEESQGFLYRKWTSSRVQVVHIVLYIYIYLYLCRFLSRARYKHC